MEVLFIPLFLFLVVGIPTFAIWQFIHFVVQQRAPNTVSDIGTGIAWFCLVVVAQCEYLSYQHSFRLDYQLLLIISGSAFISLVKKRCFSRQRDRANFFQKVFHRSLLGPISGILAFCFAQQIISNNLIAACNTGNVKKARLWHACGHPELDYSTVASHLDSAVDYGNINILNAYQAVGVDLNHYQWSKPLLIKAVHRSDYAISKWLIHHGADVSAKAPAYENDPDSGKTALQIAQRQGDIRMIALLRAAGAKE